MGISFCFGGGGERARQLRSTLITLVGCAASEHETGDEDDDGWRWMEMGGEEVWQLALEGTGYKIKGSKMEQKGGHGSPWQPRTAGPSGTWLLCTRRVGLPRSGYGDSSGASTIISRAPR